MIDGAPVRVKIREYVDFRQHRSLKMAESREDLEFDFEKNGEIHRLGAMRRLVALLNQSPC